jgi:hypothetical protein
MRQPLPGPGVVDLAFADGESASAGWTAVDFKTDREFSASSERYIVRVGLYSEAIQSLTKAPARGVLLVV